MELMPVSSKMDQTLFKAKSIIMLEATLGKKKKKWNKTKKKQPIPKQQQQQNTEIHLQPVKDVMLEQENPKWRLWHCGKPVLEQGKMVH